MKKFFAALLCLCLMLTAVTAFAEGDVPVWTMMVLENGAYDLDGDGIAENIEFTAQTDEYGDGVFNLIVNDTVCSQECVSLDGTLYAVKAGYTYPDGTQYCYGTLLLVGEYGPSDDPYTYAYFYTEGQLLAVGTVPAVPQDWTITGNGLFTTNVRATMMGTWTRPADYVFAVGTAYNAAVDANMYTYRIVEVPRTVYPMGMIVDAKIDIPVCASLYDGVATDVIRAGEPVVFSATNDVDRIYATTMRGGMEPEAAGWIAMTVIEDDGNGIYLGQCVLVDGVYVPVDEAFGNIFWAD